MTKLARRLWTGEIPLPETFWHYAVGWGLGINIGTSFLFLAVMENDVSVYIQIAVYFLPTPYNIFMLIAVWQSANRYPGPRKWVDAARIAIVIWTIALTAT